MITFSEYRGLTMRSDACTIYAPALRSAVQPIRAQLLGAM